MSQADYLRSMTRHQAKQYVHSLLTERAMLRRETERLKSRFEKAESRAREADAKGDDAARKSALDECTRVADKMQSIKSDLGDLNGKIQEAEQFVRMYGYGDGPRPSAEQLLKGFRENAGVDPDDVSVREDSESARADLALEELKRRMGMTGDSDAEESGSGE